MIGRAALGLLLAAAIPLGQRTVPAQLHGADALVRVYDYILDARFDQAEAELDRACAANGRGGGAPPEACEVLEATAIWWRIQLDPESHALDAPFDVAVAQAIEDTEAWADREPRSAEAHFYVGAAYAARVQFRVLRDQKLAAARDGKHIRQALERALELDPALDDAHFGIGMYKYYADVAPAAAKVLRFLLFLPGGDRKEGLAEMLRARARGRLLQGEADYQLQIIYLWYEKKTDRAVALLESLHERYPGNPLFLAQLADVRDVYQHDILASLSDWRALFAAAREQRVNEPGLAEVRARLNIARQLDRLYQSDRALEQLRGVVALKPVRPYGSLASAYLAIGENEDRLGRRDAAVAAYRQAIAAAPAGDPDEIRDQAGDHLRHAPDAATAEAYRLSLEGIRRLEQSDIPAAEAALTRSLQLDPDDGVARYRYGRVLQAKKDDVAALAEFEHAIARAKDMPGPLAAAAYLEAGRLDERLGRRDTAISRYRAASTWFGGGTDARAAATRALARLGAR
jgi:hypothetical protein